MNSRGGGFLIERDEAYRIRAATIADVETVVTLAGRIQHVPRWSMAEYMGAVPPAGNGKMEAGTRRCFFLALADGAGNAIVGFAIGRVTALDDEVLAELESVGVLDAARRKGVGMELCRTVVEWARGQQAREMELEVRSRNEGAIALYQRLGFAITGRRKHYYREPADDALLMRLEMG